MVLSAGGKAWSSVVGALRLTRTVESVDQGCSLVRITFENTVDERMKTIVIEDVPDHVEETCLVTSAGGDPAAWRKIGTSIIHDVDVPGGATRRTAYVIESTNDEVSVPPPRIRRVEPAAAGGLEATGEASRIESGAATDVPPAETDARGAAEGTAISLPPAGAETEARENGDEADATVEVVAIDDVGSRSTADDSDTPTEESVLDALLDELEAGVSEANARRLRNTLGIQPSERARLTHLQGRLEELAAYTEALEILVDDHGLDAITEMREAIQNNSDRTATLGDDFEELEAVVERNRSRTVDELGTIKADLAKQGAEFEEQLTGLSETLEAIRADVRSIREESRRHRQVHARDVRRLEVTISELASSLEATEASVEDLSTFRDRFRAAFTAETSPDSGGQSDDADTSSVEGPSTSPEVTE